LAITKAKATSHWQCRQRSHSLQKAFDVRLL
jgi:hypothetical protein